MEGKKHCKWYNDEFCTNGDSPCVADYCPCVEYPELCKFREVDMVEKKLTDEEKIGLDIVSLLVEFDEMGFAPTTTCPYPEEYAQRWKKALINKIHRLQAENAKQKAEIEQLTERLDYFQKSSDYHEGNQKELEAKNTELQKQVNELTEERENMQDVILGLEDKLANVLLGIKADEVLIAKGVEQAVKDTAKKFADLVEFHSIARMNDGVEYFTISALGLKEILVEEFGFKYSELNGVEVE